jgi:NADH-quinone oxidoreductase subunit A
VEAFFPVLVLLAIALVLCVGIYGVSTLLNPRNLPPVATKLNPYECGVKPEGGARQPFHSQFYLLAVLFLLFDVEAAFFFPWALVYRESLFAGAGGALLLAIAIYLGLLVLGLIYVFRKKVLELF